MTKTYLELASAYRDRLQYPNTADFVTNPCELNASDHLENQNNISDAYPFYNFWSLPLSIVRPGKQKPDGGTAADLQLISMNYGIDVCDVHLETQGRVDRRDLVPCCKGTSARPVFGNSIKPLFTIANAYEPTAVAPYVELSSCFDITSIYNVYSTTGLISSTAKQCCINQYFSGMSMTNFKSDIASTAQSCSQCSTITLSSEAATLPTSRCCDIIFKYPSDTTTSSATIYTITAQQSGAALNSVGCSTSCPVTDSIVFEMSPSFSGPFRCFDWYSLSPVTQTIDIVIPRW